MHSLVSSRKTFLFFFYFSLLSVNISIGQVAHFNATAKSENGFITLQNIGGRYIFRIPDAFLGQDILTFTRIVTTDAPITSLLNQRSPGSKVSEELVINFVKNGDSVFLQSKGLDSSGRPKVSLLYGAKVQIRDKQLRASFVDMTEVISGKNETLFFRGAPPAWVGPMKQDGSVVTYSYAGEQSLEVRTVRIYTSARLELNISFLLLPNKLLPNRFADSRMSYFEHDIKGLSKVITRWRVEPRLEDMEGFKAGRLVEPAKPIVFYMDTSVPSKWIPYFIEAFNQWNKAFEKIGFKNVVLARVCPPEDTKNFYIYDSRHSVVHYVSSIIRDATYSTVIDPRSGEILQSHIIFSSNELERLYGHYFIQASPSDENARKEVFDDSLMGSLVKKVVVHEIGHVLGMDHNMLASYSVPVKRLRDPKWLEKNGITPSIMDYARCNYVAQPQDHVHSERGLNNTMGVYDFWAIQWGYQYFSDDISIESQNAILREQVKKKSKDSRYRFGPFSDDDPRTVNESLGDNTIEASYYGILNLKYITRNAPQWNLSDGEQAISRRRALLFEQFSQYMGHVVANVGGVYQPVLEGEKERFVPAARQKRALKFVSEELFITPNWLFESSTSASLKKDTSSLKSFQQAIINRLLNMGTLYNIKKANDGKLSLKDYLADLRGYIWRELYEHTSIDTIRRSLQLNHVKSLLEIVIPNPRRIRHEVSMDMSETKQIQQAVWDELREFVVDIRKYYASQVDSQSIRHLRNVLTILNDNINQ